MANFTAASVLTATALNSAFNAKTINAQSGTTYTFVLTDHGSLVTANNASASTYTLSSATAFAVGDQIEVLNIGAGTVTLAGSGVTINGTLTIPQNGRVMLVKQAATVWWCNPVGGGGGLTFIAAGTASASATVSFNNCFSSAFENYLILYSLTAMSAAPADIQMRLRASAADNSTTNYATERISGNGATPFSDSNVNGNTLWNIGAGTTATPDSVGAITIFRPQLAANTVMTGTFGFVNTANFAGTVYGRFAATTQFDGFSIFPSSGTITTGTNGVRVYGYSNS